jgi:hypothetical protein
MEDVAEAANVGSDTVEAYRTLLFKEEESEEMHKNDKEIDNLGALALMGSWRDVKEGWKEDPPLISAQFIYLFNACSARLEELINIRSPANRSSSLPIIEVEPREITNALISEVVEVKDYLLHLIDGAF